MGGNDEFVELYNGGSTTITFDASWELQASSAVSCTGSYSTRFKGPAGGLMIPPQHHILFTNDTSPGGYSGSVTPDGTYGVGIPDAASVLLLHNGTVVDALCFYLSTESAFPCTGYICEGTPVQNPHDNNSTTDTDASLERLPGGPQGNTVDTDDNAADFDAISTSDPHDLASAATP